MEDMEGIELLVLDDSRDELQDVLRALGVSVRKFQLEPGAPVAPLDPRVTRLVLLPAFDADGCPIDRIATAIRSRSPHLPIFAWAPHNSEVQGRLLSLARAGIDRVHVVATQSDRSTLTAEIRRRLRAPPPAQVLRALAKSPVASEGKTIALWLLRNGCFPIGVQDAREMFGKDSKTLQKLLAPFDKIGVLLRLGVALHAHELQRRGIVGKAAAERLGFRGAGSLSQKEHFISRHEFNPILRSIIASP